MIRLFLTILILLVFSLFSLPMYVIQYFIGKTNPHRQFEIAQAVTRTVFRIVLFVCGVKCTVEGQENVPKDEAVLYVANHRSFFDSLVGYATVPTLTSFVAKKEMAKVPCIRTWMRYMKCLFLNREDVREGLKTILTGIEQMKEGYSVFIMPEGTRNHEEGLLPFHEGSFKFAEKSDCAIIPVAITNTDDILENHFPKIKKASVTIKYGTPIYIKDLSKEERKKIGVYTQLVVQSMLLEISGIDNIPLAAGKET